MKWLIERFREPSTWLGVFAIGSAFFHIDLTPEQEDALMQLTIALLGGGLISSKG